MSLHEEIKLFETNLVRTYWDDEQESRTYQAMVGGHQYHQERASANYVGTRTSGLTSHNAKDYVNELQEKIEFTPIGEGKTTKYNKLDNNGNDKCDTRGGF